MFVAIYSMVTRAWRFKPQWWKWEEREHFSVSKHNFRLVSVN